MNAGIHAASRVEKTDRRPAGMSIRLWKTSCSSSPYLSTHTVTLEAPPMPTTPSPMASASSVSAVHTNVCSGLVHQGQAQRLAGQAVVPVPAADQLDDQGLAELAEADHGYLLGEAGPVQEHVRGEFDLVE